MSLERRDEHDHPDIKQAFYLPEVVTFTDLQNCSSKSSSAHLRRNTSVFIISTSFSDAAVSAVKSDHSHTYDCAIVLHARTTDLGYRVCNSRFRSRSEMPRQHSFGTTLRFTDPVPADSRQ